DLAARMGIDIIAICRNKDWIINPKETEQVELGDVLITRGAPSGTKEFKELAVGKLQKMEE
ncbi:MAG: potassium channel protein, partial [Candidatus Bathyarchaeota archaeon]|nr:potassium channel protein [Candidatus Bathyarchaeota archaeon]